MLLPTDIPSEKHLDLEGNEVMRVTRDEDALIQTAMIRTHKRMMQLSGRQVTDLDACVDWVSSGYAEAYRHHYIIEA